MDMCFKQANQDVRQILDEVRKHGIYKYMVAYQIGVSEVSLSRYLRREMSVAMKEKIKDAVATLTTKGVM